MVGTKWVPVELDMRPERKAEVFTKYVTENDADVDNVFIALVVDLTDNASASLSDFHMDELKALVNARRRLKGEDAE